MSGPRLTLKIDRLRVTGASQGDAVALAESLRTSLHAQLTTQMTQSPGSIVGQSASHLRLSLPQVGGQGPTAVGRQAGHQIADALGRPKGGR